MIVFKLPDLGEGLQEAEIVEWHVKVGDAIQADQPLVSVETAKAIVEIPSPQSGRVAKLFGQPGDIVHLGAALVAFEGDGGGDADAVFDCEVQCDAKEVPPTVTWGTSPDQAMSIDGRIPDPETAGDAARAEAWRTALEYMGLDAGQPLAGTPVDWVFIGSCANSRLSDLRDAASVVRGKKVAPGVTAWVVPGSELVKRAAEAEGLDVVFKNAGFEWREPGCSMCVAANGERVPSSARAVSTSNRNFVGRQGPGARTHLASPAMAAAAAIAGTLIDIRSL